VFLLAITGYIECKELCTKKNATKSEKTVTLPKLECLWALANKMESAWNERLDEICNHHKQQAMRSEIKYDAEACLCLPALALAYLGRKQGLGCTVKSLYMPLQVLLDS
jgi:hypothetical protein